MPSKRYRQPCQKFSLLNSLTKTPAMKTVILLLHLACYLVPAIAQKNITPQIQRCATQEAIESLPDFPTSPLHLSSHACLYYLP